MKRNVAVIFCSAVIILSFFVVSTELQGEKTVNIQSIGTSIVFRLLVVEGFFANATPGTPGSVDFPMRSGQYLIGELLKFPNWQNTTNWAGYVNCTSYIHLLSYDPMPQYSSYFRGESNETNVKNEIRNFLAATGPGENNSLTIRIFYYVGHSSQLPLNFNGSYYMQLGRRGDDPVPQDPEGRPAPTHDNPSDYEELFDTELDKLLSYGDLQNSNCTLIILDTCHSGGFITKLKRKGRVILTACKSNESALGWLTVPDPAPPAVSPGQWSIFTGSSNGTVKFSNGSIFGRLGLIGALESQLQPQISLDRNSDACLSAGEIFPFACSTTIKYALNQWNTNQTPQISVGVKLSKIPIVYLNVNYSPIKVPSNGAPIKPKSDIEFGSWTQHRNDPSRTGFSSFKGTLTELLWTNSLDHTATSSSSIIVGLQVITATSGGTISDVDLMDGEGIWASEMSSGVHATCAATDGKIFVGTLCNGTQPGMIYAFDEATGDIMWEYPLPSETETFASPLIPDPVQNETLVIFAVRNPAGGSVIALNRTLGDLVWEFPTSTQIVSSPASSYGMIFVATYGNDFTPCEIFALNQTTGQVIWNVPITDNSITAGLAVADEKVFIGTSGRGGVNFWMLALNAFTGDLVWQEPAFAPISSSPAIDISHDFVIFGSEDGTLYALRCSDGSIQWTQTIGPLNLSSPVISSDGLIYIGSLDGRLYCLNETNGHIIWDFLSDGPIVSSPALIEKRILFSTMNGTLYCLGEPFPIYDFAVTEASASPKITNTLHVVNLDFSVLNNGTTRETFSVSVGFIRMEDWEWLPSPYYSTLIYKERVTLNSNQIKDLQFSWSPSQPGHYYFVVYVTSDKPEETLLNNVKTTGEITILQGASGGLGGGKPFYCN